MKTIFDYYGTLYRHSDSSDCFTCQLCNDCINVDNKDFTIANDKCECGGGFIIVNSIEADTRIIYLYDNYYLKILNELDPNEFLKRKGSLAMDWGTELALLYNDDDLLLYNKEIWKIIRAVDSYCEMNDIYLEDRSDFLSEVNEYSLK
jgi:hypothetical protein